MKFTTLALLGLSASSAVARFVEKHEASLDSQVQLNGYIEDETLYTIELSPRETRQVTEEGKWELRRVSLSIVLLPSQMRTVLTVNSKASNSWT